MRGRSSGPEERFAGLEARRHGVWFDVNCAGLGGYRSAAHRLLPEHKLHNLAPSVRRDAETYFIANGISWHQHANHGASSQVCCLNFLMPLARRPELLARLVGAALDIAPPEVLPVEPGPDGRPWFVGFEWIGGDHLGESRNGSRRRGANCTSADAVVRFRYGGAIETLLIEWKYTESYGAPLAPGRPTDADPAGHSNAVRISRYKDLVFDPTGPVRSDLGLSLADFFWEPFYQLLRQQMLAFQMERNGEDGASRVRVLHVAPAANHALRQVTSPALRRFGDDAMDVFRSLLVEQESFVSRGTERLFGPLLEELGEPDEWSSFLLGRYAFLRDPVLAQS